MRYENVRQTIRFTLAGSFDLTYPDVAKRVKDTKERNPNLFSALLPRSEQSQAAQETPAETSLLSDDEHPSAAALRKLTRVEVEQQHKPENFRDISPELKKQLTAAYFIGYSINSIPSMSTQRISYFRQFSFYSRFASSFIPAS